MTFAIESKTKARVTSVSINGENHGKDIQPAVTLSLSMTVGNDWLSNLSGHLKSSLYSKGKSSAEQQPLPGTEVSDMPSLRMPEIGSLPWTKEYTGLELVIEHGIDDSSAIVVPDCKADNIVVTAKDGGSVEVDFKLKSNKPDEETRGRLTSLIKRDVELRVKPPEPSTQGKLHEEREKGATDPAIKKGAKAFEKAVKQEMKKDSDPSGNTAPWPFPKTAEAKGDDPVLAAAKEAHGVKDAA